jgi:uncharacterized membrane protein YqaE (UPF0057 family)
MPVGVIQPERRVCLLVCYNPNVVYACWCVTTRTSWMPVGVLQPERRVCLLVCYNPNVVYACWCVSTRTSWMPVGVLQPERRGCLLMYYNPIVVNACSWTNIGMLHFTYIVQTKQRKKSLKIPKG